MKTRIHWRMATTMNPFYCRRCWNSNPRTKLSFAMKLCEEFNIFPYWKFPHYATRIRAMVIRHYKKEHLDYEVY